MTCYTSGNCPRFRSGTFPRALVTFPRAGIAGNLCLVGEELEALAFRNELGRVLASPEFASRQLQDFLSFTSEKALSGEKHLDQVEIASLVLGRTDTFNPIEDSSVRKLASRARKRLDEYYRRTGIPEAGIVTIPLRSYLPQFEQSAVEDEPLPPPRQRRWRLPILAASATLLACASWLAIMHTPAPEGIRFRITTSRGDIIAPGLDILPEAVQLGPELLPFEEITVRLDFTPIQEAQQAGILIWDAPDRFIKLGRRFHGRNQVDFMAGSGAATTYQKIAYDPEGQSGKPVWLALRRNRNTYSAFTSTDGLKWEPWGDPISLAIPLKAPRAGIYGFHGRRDAQPATAVFEHLSTGVNFALTATDDPATMLAGGWSQMSTCPDAGQTSIRPPALLLAYSTPRSHCNFEFTRPLRKNTEWQIETRLDYLTRPGISAGIAVHGSKGTVRLVRYFLNGPSIAFIYDGHTLVGTPDLNGSPPVVLRLRAHDGSISASFSADGEHYRKLAQRVELSALGENLRAGLRSQTSTIDPEETPQSLRFYWYSEAIAWLTPYR